MMAISYETIINQMIKRLENAKECKNNKEELMKQIYYVHGMCELFIEENKETSEIKESVSHNDIVTMLENKTNISTSTKIDDGDSLLDF